MFGNKLNILISQCIKENWYTTCTETSKYDSTTIVSYKKSKIKLFFKGESSVQVKIVFKVQKMHNSVRIKVGSKGSTSSDSQQKEKKSTICKNQKKNIELTKLNIKFKYITS
jgi:hypothetical protein